MGKRTAYAVITTDANQKWYWRLHAANNRLVAMGTNEHKSEARAREELHRVSCGRGHLLRWEVYQDKDDKWRWRAVHLRKKDIVCVGDEPFSSKQAAQLATDVPFGIMAEWEHGDVPVKVRDA